MSKNAIFLILIFTLKVSNLSSEALEIPIFTYHTHPPFLTSDEEGLTSLLSDYLTLQSDGIFQFIVYPMSRLKVDKMLEQKKVGIIPWVSPPWFFDSEEKKYIWTDRVLMEDGISIISRITDPIEYKSLESLRNLRFGGIKGHHYTDFDELVSDGILTRIDGDSHIENYRKILHNKIDFAITPYSSAEYLVRSYNLADELYISTQMQTTYLRRILISDGNIELKDFLDKALKNLRENPVWDQLELSNDGIIN